MAQSAVEKILAERKPALAAVPDEKPEDKFFSILGADGLEEQYLELQFRTGMRTCFNYEDLLWFSFEPEAGYIDLEFGGYMVAIKGRGLGQRLFEAIKKRRVAWVKEADSEMQDHKGNDCFIEEITIEPPESKSGGGDPAAE